MKIVPIGRQKWKGHFTYVNELEGGTIFENEVPFEMDLIFNKNSFSGTTIDEETKGLFDRPITVNGFVEGEEISFIVMYPYNYYVTEEGKIVVDFDNDYPGCEYEGKYDTDESKFAGEWTLVIDEFKEGQFQPDYIQEFLSGNWEMRKVK